MKDYVSISSDTITLDELAESTDVSTERLAIRVDNLPNPLMIQSLPLLVNLVVETNRPTTLILRDLPSLQTVSTSGISVVRREDHGKLKLIQYCNLRKVHSDVIPVPEADTISFQNVSLSSAYKFQSLEASELSFSAIRSNLELTAFLPLAAKLTKLHIFRVKGVLTDAIPLFRSLRLLWLVDVGRIPSIAFLEGMNSLEEVNLGGDTVVADGKLRVLETLPNLKRVLFSNRRHYDMRMSNYDFDLANLVRR